LQNVNHTPSPSKVKIETKKLDLSNVKSKCGSLQNSSHRPGGGNVKIENRPLNFVKKSKVGSLEYIKHSPGGGDKKIETRKLDFSHVPSKAGRQSLENAAHRAHGGQVKIFDEKPQFKSRAKSKIGSLHNIDHQPGGGDVLVYDEANSKTRKFLRESLVLEDNTPTDETVET